ncbi:MAG TPA: TetR/AcrR family transcriptional regulator [Acidimicrobiales bacterium]|nr:TetR/AcrR family transcriptional regulator [Acidimicrobiales bacterium]
MAEAIEVSLDGAVGAPAAQRALRTQGRRTMRRLLDAAMKAIDERGYHATRVQDVVDIAKTSHGTFYLYFSNKEDLVRALTVEAASEATKMSQAMAEAGSAVELESWDGLRSWVAGYSALWSHYAPLFRSWTDLVAIDEGVEDQIRRMVVAHTDAVASRVAASERADGLDPQVAATAVVAMLDRFHFLRDFVGSPVDDDAIDMLTTMIHRALFATPG